MNSLSKNRLVQFLIYLIVVIFVLNFFGMYVTNYYFNDGDFRDSFGFLFKPDDRPPVSLDSSIGLHYFGDTSELAYLSKLEDPYTNEKFQQSYPPLLILLFKNFISSGQHVLIFNIFIHLFSLLLIFSSALKSSKDIDFAVKFLLFFVVCSKFFIYSLDRGNIEFFIISILFFVLFFDLTIIQKTLLLSFAISLKPSILIFIPIFGFKILSITGIITFFIYAISFLLLKEPIFNSFLNMVNAFSSTKFPTLHNWQLLEQDLSIWGKIYWLRHLDIIVESSFGSFLQSIYNNRSIIFYLVIVITWSIYISKNKGKSHENNAELWIFISLTSILLFSFSGVYKSAILIIPLFILMKSNKPIRNENLYIFLITMIFLQVPIFRHMFNFDIYSDLSIWSFFSFAVSLIFYSVIINHIVFKAEKNE
tara:strand:+ start:1842 stop:3104 length:1263 start_codon:yes stop_codon:yes gene_type:complete